MCAAARGAKQTLHTEAAEAAVQVEHRLNLARSCETDWENGYKNKSPVFSHKRCPIAKSVQRFKITANKIIKSLNITHNVF